MAANVIQIRRPARNAVTRKALLASWRAVEREADGVGAMVLNEAATAGMLLDKMNGNPLWAIENLPAKKGAFWNRVREYLERVSREED